MRGHRAAGFLIDHDLGIAMVRGDQHHPAEFGKALDQPADAAVHGLHRGDGRSHDPAVPHHVAVGKIEHHQAVGIIGKAAKQLFGHRLRAHLRLEIVGGHFAGGWEQGPLFQRVWGFTAAIEKIGNVGVFFRLGDAQLP